MTSAKKAPNPSSHPPTSKAKKDKLAKALRDNLRRRKQAIPANGSK